MEWCWARGVWYLHTYVWSPSCTVGGTWGQKKTALAQAKGLPVESHHQAAYWRRRVTCKWAIKWLEWVAWNTFSSVAWKWRNVLEKYLAFPHAKLFTEGKKLKNQIGANSPDFKYLGPGYSSNNRKEMEWVDFQDGKNKKTGLSKCFDAINTVYTPSSGNSKCYLLSHKVQFPFYWVLSHYTLYSLS